ncbi:dihydrolipoamide acetyltransferase family protein [Amycolatopsis sp. NPDC049253]|uniref:dihydrolipoamide acetyltransferase family protein n=1 Tax=Amycolatopsis sp. NPDC049253 TaxID=3155274 RepID=UPI003447E035
MAEFLMPALGADMTEGTVLEWLVKAGDTVRKGDIVAVVDTDKAAIEVECFTSGTVSAVLVPVGSRVPVGTPLAVLAAGPGMTEVGPTQDERGPAPETVPHVEPGPPAEVRLATPPTRKFAAESGVDLTTVHGSGRDGRVTHADVARAIAARTSLPAGRVRISPYARKLATELGVAVSSLSPTQARRAIHARDVRAAAQRRAERAPVRHSQDAEAMRRAIGALMARAKREIPHYYLSTTIDLHTAVEWLREHNLHVPIPERLLPAALLLKATALAARRAPQLNGHWVDDSFRPADSVHLGTAVALRGGGLLTPVILDAADRSASELMAELRAAVTRARTGALRSTDLTAGTITVTNLGDNGVESVHGVIYPPQVALVGFGAITSRPWAVDGLLGVRPLVTATLSADHRASDGATGARFLSRIAALLQQPEEL